MLGGMEKQSESEENGDCDRERKTSKQKQQKKNVCTLLKDSSISTDIDFDTEELMRDELMGNRRRGGGGRYERGWTERAREVGGGGEIDRESVCVSERENKWTEKDAKTQH